MRSFTDKEYHDMLMELKTPYPRIEVFCQNHSMAKIEAAYLALTVLHDSLELNSPPGYFTIYASDARKLLLDSVFSIYLESWLAADANQAQTITSFSAELERYNNKEIDSPYISKNERYKHEEVHTQIYQQEAFQRRAFKYLDMYECLKRQEGNNLPQNATPYHRQSSTNSQHGWRWFSPMQLCFMHHLHDGDLRLWEMLVYRTVPLKSSNNRSDLTALKVAYETYDRMVRMQKENTNSKEYTIFCLMLRSFEESHRFHLFAQIAKEMQRLNIPPETPLPELFDFFWGRSNFSEYSIGINLLPHDPVCSGTLISRLFSVDSTLIQQSQATALEQRNHFSQLLYFVWRRLTPALLGNWTKKDFDLAAKFFREDYKFIKDYESVNFGESVKDVKCGYTYIFNLYNQLMFSPENATYRAYMQKENRKRSPSKKRDSSQTETES